MSKVRERFMEAFLKTAAPAACATLLWTAAALATTSAQQKCDNARIGAWKKYVSCVEGVVAKDAKGTTFDEFAAFAKCRHKYFGKWTAFQSFTGSTCFGSSRFMDNSDQTVTDKLSGLVWEKKDGTAGIHSNFNTYTWSTDTKENGTAFSSFLSTLNSGGFAGANGWRLPTLAELQTIVLDFACKGDGEGPTCSCPSSPCVDPALDANHTSSSYWSATGSIPVPGAAWHVNFDSANLFAVNDTMTLYTRAVRGGL